MKHTITFEIPDCYFEEVKNLSKESALTVNSQAENFFILGLAARKFLPPDVVDKLWEQVFQTFHPKADGDDGGVGEIMDRAEAILNSEDAQRKFLEGIVRDRNVSKKNAK